MFHDQDEQVSLPPVCVGKRLVLLGGMLGRVIGWRQQKRP